MNIFDRYVFSNLSITTGFIAVTLTVVILLTQSLRFLELVIESGASSSAFWVLTFLALPRFLEIILPLAIMAAVLFVYNRMTMDSELVVIRSVGFSPMSITRPALLLTAILTVFLWGVTMWGAPKALSSMNHMRQVIKAQFSSLLFREGVFNKAGDGLTVYIRERAENGDLQGLMIHDTRSPNAYPSTILAQRGVLISNDDKSQVLVYDGTRQQYDPKNDTLNRLNFDRYTIDLPESDPVRQRWSEPNERTIIELLNPDITNKRDKESLRDFRVEIHRRFVTPLLAPIFCLISCCALLLGPVDRRGQSKRILMAILSVMTIQGLFLSAFNIARNSDFGLLFIYLLIITPLCACSFILSGTGERFRRHIFYKKKEAQT